MKSDVENKKLPGPERAFNSQLLSGGNVQALGTIQDAARGGAQALQLF